MALSTLSTKEWVLLGSLSAAMPEQAVGLCMDSAQQQHYQEKKKKAVIVKKGFYLFPILQNS